MGYGMCHIGCYVKRVAWQVERKTGFAEAEAVGIDKPFCGRGGRVDSGRIAQGDIKTAFAQSGTIYFCCFCIEVDTFRR